MAAAGDEYDGSNATGFVSPAGDALEGPVDLAEDLDLRRPNRYPATSYWRRRARTAARTALVRVRV